MSKIKTRKSLRRRHYEQHKSILQFVKLNPDLTLNNPNLNKGIQASLKRTSRLYNSTIANQRLQAKAYRNRVKLLKLEAQITRRLPKNSALLEDFQSLTWYDRMPRGMQSREKREWLSSINKFTNTIKRQYKLKRGTFKNDAQIDNMLNRLKIARVLLSENTNNSVDGKYPQQLLESSAISKHLIGFDAEDQKKLYMVLMYLGQSPTMHSWSDIKPFFEGTSKYKKAHSKSIYDAAVKLHKNKQTATWLASFFK